MELPQSQLALDPCVTKFHDSSTATISLLDFLAGHLAACGVNEATSSLKMRSKSSLLTGLHGMVVDLSSWLL
jgi:hypothetical protein